MVEKILAASDPVDFMMQSSPSDWLTTMPVAQAPSTKALIAKSGCCPNAVKNDTCRSSFVSVRSSQPRTQLVGAPVLPEDSRPLHHVSGGGRPSSGPRCGTA